MTDPPIVIQNVSKIFGKGDKRVVAVKDLSLEVPEGFVFGFLGPNGAGKTTTIRLMMDLIRPTKGCVNIYGQPVHGNGRVLKRVGALVEGAAFYDYMSGKHNLEIFSRTANDFNPIRIDELLTLVGLQERADENVGGYSTGMKQRLGIATALLGDPDLVILDEPTNGLDPAGIQEMRQFIRDLAHKHGKTVFLSSHLLHEVEQVCDYVGIINKGELVRASSVADLLSEGRITVRVQASPIPGALSALSERWESHLAGEWINVDAKPDDSPAIVKLLVANDVSVHQVVVQKQTLEELFIEVTQNNDDEILKKGGSP